VDAQCRVPREQDHVVAEPVCLQLGDVLVGRAPIPAEVAHIAAEESVQLRHGLNAGVRKRSRTEPAVAVDFGRDALLDLAVAGWTHQQRKIRVCMHVDEAWAYHTTGGVDTSRYLD